MPKKILFLFYCLLPFSFALPLGDGIDAPLARLFILLFFLILSAFFFRKECWANSLLSVSLFLFWLLWACLSSFWSLDMTWSYRKLFFLMNLLPLFFFLVLSHQRDLKQGIRGLVIGSVLVSLVALLQVGLQFLWSLEGTLHLWLEYINPIFLGRDLAAIVARYPSLLVNILGNTYLRATAFFPDPHTLSLYLGSTLPFLYAWQYQKGYVWKMAFGVTLFAFLASFSRGGYIALFLVMLCALLSLGPSYLVKNWKILTLSFLLLFGIVFFTPFGSRLFSSWSSSDGSRTERLRLLEEAVDHVGVHPWLGVGLGNYPLLLRSDAMPDDPIYAHNLYLDIAVEQGLIGLTLFLLSVCYFLMVGWKNWKLGGDQFSGAAFFGILYILFHGFFEVPIYSYHVLAVMFLLLCYQVSTYERH